MKSNCECDDMDDPFKFRPLERDKTGVAHSESRGKNHALSKQIVTKPNYDNVSKPLLQNKPTEQYNTGSSISVSNKAQPTVQKTLKDFWNNSKNNSRQKPNIVNGPLCQMPLHLVVSSTHHMAQCVERRPLRLLPPCPDALLCTSKVMSHYSSLEHTALAQHRSKYESHNDKPCQISAEPSLATSSTIPSAKISFSTSSDKPSLATSPVKPYLSASSTILDIPSPKFASTPKNLLIALSSKISKPLSHYNSHSQTNTNSNRRSENSDTNGNHHVDSDLGEAQPIMFSSENMIKVITAKDNSQELEFEVELQPGAQFTDLKLSIPLRKTNTGSKITPEIISSKYTEMKDPTQQARLPEMQAVIQLGGTKVPERRKKLVVKKKQTFSTSTVTPLVREVFESVFSQQMGQHGRVGDKRGKFKSKESAARAVQGNGIHKEFEWIGEGIRKGRGTYYKSVVLDGYLTVSLGDTVLIHPTVPSSFMHVARITNMFEGLEGPTVHVHWFAKGSDTVLGETADTTELFLVTSCGDQPLLSVCEKCTVNMRTETDLSSWRQLSSEEVASPSQQEIERENGRTFWSQLWYSPEHARFEYPKLVAACNVGEEMVFCEMCVRKEGEKQRWKPSLGEKNDAGDYTFLTWDGGSLKLGDTVYLKADTGIHKRKSRRRENITGPEKENMDDELYPEYYRKTGNVHGTNVNNPQPFQLAIVKKICHRWGGGGDEKVKLVVQMFYRAEDVHSEVELESSRYNLVFWTEKVVTVPFSAVTGRCWVRFAGLDISDEMVDSWAEKGQDRWFFRESYNGLENRTEKAPISAVMFGKKYSWTEECCTLEDSDSVDSSSFPPVVNKLACLDIFSGCGGLSHGLHQSGVAETKWAVELSNPAAQAFKINYPECTVFTEDCNVILKKAMEGIKSNNKRQNIPLRGEVDLLCGGPPCQGFSGMNRFNQQEYSQFKNSLVATYLSFCEYYRPRFFILENVRNFATFKKSMVLKLCLRTLVKMGYQCTFGILQAGQFGLAQTRRRLFLLAASPGETLPLFPEPRHVFSPQACHLSVEIDSARYYTNARWVQAGPFRTVTVRDTMSDLPLIKNGDSKLKISYGMQPKSNFQRIIRDGSEVLRDHVTRKMSAMVEARFKLIPTVPGSDWRDLPNQVIELPDGSQCYKLVYGYDDLKQVKSSKGSKRGVCRCADGKSKCDPEDRQQKTLIPWYLPHTANRHNNWSGVYGRVEWEGFFSTIITSPQPMGKQGRVIHPDQNRLVSVREFARSQGFPDSYRFNGKILDKHRQIGNAVPPPLGKAVGLQIREALRQRKLNNEMVVL